MISPPAPDASFAYFDQAIQSTRAKYNPQVLSLRENIQRLPDNQLLRFELARLLEPYIELERLSPSIVLNQPGPESDVWMGTHELGMVVDTGVPCKFDADLFACGGVTIIAGATRSGKTTLMMNLLRGFLADGRARVTVFDPNGGVTGLVRLLPGQIAAFNLYHIPLGIFSQTKLVDAVSALMSETYNIKLSRSELIYALHELVRIYEEATGGAVCPALGDLLAYLAGNYWRNPFDKAQGLRRTTVTTLQGIWTRCPGLRVARGADPARDLFSRNLILTTEDFEDIQDLRFIIAFLIHSLWHELKQTVTRFDTLRHFIVFDDATSLVMKEADRCTTTGMSSLVEATTRIGKYGVNLVFLTQSIEMISDVLLSNAANLIVCGSLSNDEDLLRAQRILGLETRQ